MNKKNSLTSTDVKKYNIFKDTWNKMERKRYLFRFHGNILYVESWLNVIVLNDFEALFSFQQSIKMGVYPV